MIDTKKDEIDNDIEMDGMEISNGINVVENDKTMDRQLEAMENRIDNIMAIKNKIVEDKRLYNGKIFNLEVKLIKYYIEHKLRNKLDFFGLDRLIACIRRVNSKDYSTAETKIRRLEKLITEVIGY